MKLFTRKKGVHRVRSLTTAEKKRLLETHIGELELVHIPYADRYCAISPMVEIPTREVPAWVKSGWMHRVVSAVYKKVYGSHKTSILGPPESFSLRAKMNVNWGGTYPILGVAKLGEPIAIISMDQLQAILNIREQRWCLDQEENREKQLRSVTQAWMDLFKYSDLLDESRAIYIDKPLKKHSFVDKHTVNNQLRLPIVEGYYQDE